MKHTKRMNRVIPAALAAVLALQGSVVLAFGETVTIEAKGAGDKAQNLRATVTEALPAVYQKSVEQLLGGTTPFLNLELAADKPAAGPLTITLTLPKSLRQAGDSYGGVQLTDGVATLLADGDSSAETVTLTLSALPATLLLYNAPAPAAEPEKPAAERPNPTAGGIPPWLLPGSVLVTSPITVPPLTPSAPQQNALQGGLLGMSVLLTSAAVSGGMELFPEDEEVTDIPQLDETDTSF